MTTKPRDDPFAYAVPTFEHINEYRKRNGAGAVSNEAATG
jgi:hypothetical protein